MRPNVWEMLADSISNLIMLEHAEHRKLTAKLFRNAIHIIGFLCFAIANN